MIFTIRFPLRQTFLLMLLAFGSCAWAGTPFGTAVGNPPVCTSLAWRPWYFKLLNFRLAECPVNRASTYYFAQSGSDTSGDGSENNPWKSIAKAQAVLNASGGNLALLFKRGDVWKETATYTFSILSGGNVGSNTITVAANVTHSFPVLGQAGTLTGGTSEKLAFAGYSLTNGILTFSFTTPISNPGHTALQMTLPSGLDIALPNVTVGAWGPGTQKPVFSAFLDTLAGGRFVSAAMRGDGLTRTWSQTDPNTVGWVREANDDATIYRRMLSASQVDATPASWYQDPATQIVYIHAAEDVALNVSGRNFEAVPYNNANGVYVNGVDGTRIDSLRVEGYSCAHNNLIDPAGARAYGIKGTVNGTNACVVSNSDCFYSHNHAIGILGDTSGGIVTYDNCRAGWDTANDTPYVAYNPEGGQECIVHECECPGAVAPYGLQPYADGSPFTEHAGPVRINPSYSVGQPTLSLLGNHANVPLTPGLTLILVGGASETLTVQSYDSGTGRVTFTSAVSSGGHTGFVFTSGPYRGGPVTYNSSISVLYGCRNRPGPYQQSSLFSGPQTPPPWTDLLNCRSWDVDERFFMRTPAAIDTNTLVSALDPAAQSTSAVTLTNPNPGSAVPRNASWVTLTGGPAGPESLQVANFAAGKVTFATAITGSGRTAIEYNVGPKAAATRADFQPVVAASYTAVINGDFEGGETYCAPSNADSSLEATCPNDTCLFLNCTFVADWTNVSSTNASRYRTLFFIPPGAPGFAAYNCRFHFRVAGRDVAGTDINTMKYGVPTQIKIYNSIFSGEYAEGGTAPGLGNDPGNQINNAYSGMTLKTGAGGYDADPHSVELSATLPFGHPDLASPLLSADTQLVLGRYALEYDADWMPRSMSTPAIGPYEPLY